MSVDNVSYKLEQQFDNSQLHSLLLFNLDELPSSFRCKFLAKFKVLKVLDLEDASVAKLPKDLGHLFHLRYLSLKNINVMMLPKSIGKLRNLETLDLQQSLVHEIPVAIDKIDKLRHLLAYYHDWNVDFGLANSVGVKIQGRVGCLKSLQMPLYVDTNHGGVDLIKELGKLRQLRHLGLTNLTRGTGRALCGFIEKMNNLEFLDASLISKKEIIDLNHISSPPQQLQELYIKGRLDKLSNWIPKLQHLVCVNILWSRLGEDPLKIFENYLICWSLELRTRHTMGRNCILRKEDLQNLRSWNSDT